MNNSTTPNKTLAEILRKPLVPTHIQQHCVDRGLDQAWVAANCESIGENDAVKRTGHRKAGLLMQGENNMCQLRPNEAEDGRKYLTPPKSLMPYDAMLFRHPTIDKYWVKENLLEHSIKIKEHPYIVLGEGLFKSICCGQKNLACISLPGVTMGMVGRADDENKPLVPALQSIVDMGFGVIIAFDADSARNFAVRRAHKALAAKLEENGANVLTITGLWDEKDGKGLDDYVQKRGWKAFLKLLENAITNEEWNDRFPVFYGYQFTRTIETTVAEKLFDNDWAVIDDVFYQYQRGSEGGSGVL